LLESYAIYGRDINPRAWAAWFRELADYAIKHAEKLEMML
jgi:hypothetical protein